jgi:hypothetical protein
MHVVIHRHILISHVGGGRSGGYLGQIPHHADETQVERPQAKPRTNDLVAGAVCARALPCLSPVWSWRTLEARSTERAGQRFDVMVDCGLREVDL